MRNEEVTTLLARLELLKRADFEAPASKKDDGEFAGTPPAKLTQLYEALKAMTKQYQFKAVNAPFFEEEHQTWTVSFQDAQGAIRRIDWTLAATPEYRQMMAKFVQIKDELQAPFVIEAAPKGKAAQEEADAEDAAVEAAAGAEAGVDAPEKVAKKAAPRVAAEPVVRQTARELFDYVIEQGRREYQVQRYKGLGEMTATQLWETTMDPEKRTLLSVKLEDLAESETIFTTLMGEDVESRRKFIEENALDVQEPRHLGRFAIQALRFRRLCSRWSHHSDLPRMPGAQHLNSTETKPKQKGLSIMDSPFLLLRAGFTSRVVGSCSARECHPAGPEFHPLAAVTDNACHRNNPATRSCSCRLRGTATAAASCPSLLRESHRSKLCRCTPGC